MVMNIDYELLKIKNRFGLMRSRPVLLDIIETCFLDMSGLEKQLQIKNILHYINSSKNKKEALNRVITALSSSKSEYSNGFLFAIDGLSK